VSDDGARGDGGRGLNCFGCGAHNERGLRMEFRTEGERAVCIYTPEPHHQGYPGRMHGGLVSTMLDEAMGWAVYGARAWGATARLSVRFRQPVLLDQPLRVEAWVTRNRSRLLELRGEVRDSDGLLLAEADGTFMKLDDSMAAELSDVARGAGRSDAPIV
jgi:acyl-coenzyme A thioesterase PaaI-like protein